MGDRDDPDSEQPERRKSSGRMSWLFGRARKGSVPQYHDSEETPVTVLNRSRLAVVAAEMLNIAVKTREAVACTCIEVRGLKAVDPVAGHDDGNREPDSAADALGEVFRRSDVLAQISHNRFIVLSMGSGPAADDVERRMAQRLTPSGGADSSGQAVEISAGRVVHMPWEDEDLAEIMERADQEMFRRRKLNRARDFDLEEQ